MSINLFINFCFFDFECFKGINIQAYCIEKNFHKLLKHSNNNVLKLEKELFSKSCNKSIFYFGLEKTLETKHEKFLKNNYEKIKSIIFYDKSKYIIEAKGIKTILKTKDNSHGKRLFSSLITVESLNYNNLDNCDYNDEISKMIHKNYYLFPISFDNFHEK